jgi:hypothetical protein
MSGGLNGVAWCIASEVAAEAEAAVKVKVKVPAKIR